MIRAILSGAAAMVSLYLIVGSYGTDVERVVKRPLPEVYTSVENLFLGRSGTVTITDEGKPKRVDVLVDRVPEKSIRYRVDLEGKPVLDMNIAFAAAGNGAATELSGEMSMEQDFVRIVSGGDPEKSRHIAGFAVDHQFAQMIGQIGDAIEADQPLNRGMVFGGIDVDNS